MFPRGNMPCYLTVPQTGLKWELFGYFSRLILYMGEVYVMKKFLIFSIVTALFLSVLSSCGTADIDIDSDRGGNESEKNYNDTEWLNDDTHYISDLQECDFGVQYIRTDGYQSGAKYPVVKIIRSVDELNTYYEANKDNYSLERHSGPPFYSYSTIGFLDACDKYDAAYFEDQILLMILLEEGSGSIRHEVESVGIDSGDIWVKIKSIVPEACTDDMAEWHILIEPEAGVDVTDKENVVVFMDGRNITEKITEVYYEKGYANIALTLKEGWEYDIVDEPDTDEFSINIYPAGQKDNKLRIAYFNGFGVCGTGLKQEGITLGRYDAWMGTYDNNTVWDFISIRDTFGDYAILNEGGEKWWSEYGNDAMQILATLKVADGYVSEAGAVQAAKDKANSTDAEPKVEFDYENYVWRVTLSGKNTDGDDTFVIDIHGNIVEIID